MKLYWSNSKGCRSSYAHKKKNQRYDLKRREDAEVKNVPTLKRQGKVKMETILTHRALSLNSQNLWSILHSTHNLLWDYRHTSSDFFT